MRISRARRGRRRTRGRATNVVLVRSGRATICDSGPSRARRGAGGAHQARTTAAVEGLETYEERIGDIADHVLGLVAPDVPSIIKLDAIERRCGEERIAARRAEARVAELEEERDFILNGEFADLTKLRAIADAAEALRDATRARLTGAVEDALSKVDAALAARKDGGR